MDEENSETIIINNYKITFYKNENAPHLVQVAIRHTNNRPIEKEDKDYFEDLFDDSSKYRELVNGLKILINDLEIFPENDKIHNLKFENKKYNLHGKFWFEKNSGKLRTNIGLEEYSKNITISEVKELFYDGLKWKKLKNCIKQLLSLIKIK
ncbi:MAG: hypothetical protein ACTSPY_17135 [Candidatus Helarchaeota archaeon]